MTVDPLHFLQVFIAGLSTGSTYSLAALGLMLVYRGTRVLNFGHGDFVTCGAYIGLFFMMFFKFSYWGIFIASLITMTLLGLLLERVLIRPLIRAPDFTIVISTLAIGLLVKNTLRLVYPEVMAALPSPFSRSSVNIGTLFINPQYLWIILCALIAMGILALFLNKTVMGTAMRAVAQHQEGARLMGISVNWVFAGIFGISLGLAALSGVLVAPLEGVHPEMGAVSMKALAAAVLGGFGSLPGAVVGGLLLGVLEAMGSYFIGGTFRNLTAFVLLIVVLSFRPQGLLGRKEVRRV